MNLLHPSSQVRRSPVSPPFVISPLAVQVTSEKSSPALFSNTRTSQLGNDTSLPADKSVQVCKQLRLENGDISVPGTWILAQRAPIRQSTQPKPRLGQIVEIVQSVAAEDSRASVRVLVRTRDSPITLAKPYNMPAIPQLQYSEVFNASVRNKLRFRSHFDSCRIFYAPSMFSTTARSTSVRRQANSASCKNVFCQTRHVPSWCTKTTPTTSLTLHRCETVFTYNSSPFLAPGWTWTAVFISGLRRRHRRVQPEQLSRIPRALIETHRESRQCPANRTSICYNTITGDCSTISPKPG